MSNSDNELEADFKSWNPLLEDFNNPELNKYFSGPGVGLNELLQNEEQKPQLAEGGANIDMRDKLPYLTIRSNRKTFSETTIRNILKHTPIHHCSYGKRYRQFFVYFNAIADLEEAYRVLEKCDYITSLIVGQPKKRKSPDNVQESNDNEQKNEESSLPESANAIKMEDRTIKISDYNPNHPIFGPHFLLHPDAYNQKNSFLKEFDPLYRFKHITDEHVPERCTIFNVLPSKIDKYAINEYCSGRAIPKFSDNFESKKPIDGNVSIDYSKWSLEKCYICGTLCKSHCSVCLTYCCSMLSCLEKIYPEHKLTCPTKIALVYKPKEIIPPMKIFQNKIPLSGSKVQLTAFQQSNVVYVRSIETGPNNAHFNVLNKVCYLGKKAQKYQVTPKCGDLVLVRVENEFLRGLVLNSDQKDSIYVTYIDFGNVDQQPVDNFYVICKELTILPCHVIAVELKDVPYRFMPLQYRSFLYRLLSHEFIIKYEKRAFDFGKALYIVELFDDVLQMTLNRSLISLLTPRVQNEIFFENSLNRFPLPSGTTIQLAITDNSLITVGFITCTTKELAYEIDKYQLGIQAFGEAQASSCYCPRVNELCIAKNETDGKWCRGSCLEVVGDGYPTIQFIDYGNIEFVPIEKIHKYPAMFTYPIITEDLYLDGFNLDIKDDETIKKLRDVFPIGGIITCEPYRQKDDNSLNIKMPKFD